MGSSSTKFRKHIQSGDEYAALHLYSSSSDLRKALDPNVSYGDSYNHDTPMHVVARHAMKSLLRIFLFDLGGNPNKKNARNETVLHCVCAGGINDKSLPQKIRRGECILLCLQWRGTKLANGSVECVDLTAADESENTALHYTAMSGLQHSVELLVAYGSPLFVENAAKETPCDCAEKSGHSQIALYLESKMVFSNEDQNADELGVLMSQLENEEGYSGLRAQDLQEAKDQLLVETSDMLHVPLFTAEALLRNHEWSREMLLEAWIENAVACCEKCGVIPPATLMSDDRMHRSETVTGTSAAIQSMVDEEICEICVCVIPSSEEPVSMTCEHHFCRACWQIYLTGKIIEGETHHITCPGYECTRLVPVELIENLVSREMARRYLQFDIKAFVESNPMIKWCPYPGCGRAVRLPDSDNPMSPLFRSSAHVHSPIDTSHAVDCGNGHIFCWECLGEAHEPASCENWNNWHKKISDIKPEELNGTEEETENSANCLWLITNSKACPNCKSPIQKNEGCNHMKCSKCKFDFCWVCLEAWKKHSTATGGYFRCNRYEIVKKVEESHDNLKSEAEVRNKKMQELNRFVHYYSRFKNHENSYKLETALYDTAKEKMLILARAVSDSREMAMRETKFVQDAITQLLKARHVLKCSYVYGYFLDDVGYKKPIFEFMQTELEECTEALSEMIARPYLHTPRTKIVQTAHLVQRKRHELVAAIAKGLVPPDTSPATQKKKTYRVDEDTRKALLASLQDESFNLWVRDVSSGRHPNIPPVLNWPEASDESDSETSPSRVETAASLGSTGGNEVVELNDSDLQMPGFAGLGVCSRNSCHQRRAVNQLTGQVLDYCSIECMRLDRAEETADYPHGDNVVFGQNEMAELINDYQLDLFRALEMSRLQFLREIGSLRPGIGDSYSPIDSSPMPSPRSSMSPTTKTRAQSTNDADLTDTRHLMAGVSGLSLDRAAVTAAISRSIAASPRLSMSSVEFETIPTMSSSTTDFRVRRTLDQELTRALEISQLNLHDEERDMCLAIALSIQDTAGSAPQLSNTAVHRPHEIVNFPAAHCSTAGPFSFSGISELPTRSEQTRDLSTVRSQAAGCGTQTMPCMGLSSLRGATFSDRSTASLSRPLRRSDVCCVSSHFDYGFPRQSTPVDSTSSPLVVESVFEPRPPHATFTLPSASTTVFPVERCALAHDETVMVLDPWRRRPSSLDHGRPNQRCIRSSVCCESTKCNSVTRRRRSCGTRLPHHHDHVVTESAYLNDCSISSTPTCGIMGTALSTNPSFSSDELSAESSESRHISMRQQDSIDLVISSDILESMLQGTAGYVVDEVTDVSASCGWTDCRPSGSTMPETVELSPAPVENDPITSQLTVCSPSHVDSVSKGQSDDGDAVFV